MFNLFGSRTKAGGFVSYYRLDDWWFSTFTEEERTHIVDKYEPLGLEKGSITNASFTYASGDRFSFLYTLASWFNNPTDRRIALKIIRKAEEYLPEEHNILSLHFFYPTKMKIFYRERDTNPDALNEAIASCLRQIDLAPEAAKAFRKEYHDHELPIHEGYEQLCIIREKQGDIEGAMMLAKQAKMQGWGGDWSGRMTRLEKKKERNASKNSKSL